MIYRPMLLVSGLIMLSFSPVAAQTPGNGDATRPDLTTFADLPGRIKPGQTIYVTTSPAGEVRGRLLRLSAASVTLLVQGQERELARPDILRVEKRGDSLSDGMTIGFAVGGGLGLLSILSGGCGAPFGLGACALMTGTLAGMGMGIGALGDWALRGKTVVYTAPSSRITARPVLLNTGIGVAVRF